MLLSSLLLNQLRLMLRAHRIRDSEHLAQWPRKLLQRFGLSKPPRALRQHLA